MGLHGGNTIDGWDKTARNGKGHYYNEGELGFVVFKNLWTAYSLKNSTTSIATTLLLYLFIFYILLWLEEG